MNIDPSRWVFATIRSNNYFIIQAIVSHHITFTGIVISPAVSVSDTPEDLTPGF